MGIFKGVDVAFVTVAEATVEIGASPFDEGAEAAFVAKVKALAPKYRTELYPFD